nr:Hpt domain-containing protein [Azospirillum sp. INR13]
MNATLGDRVKGQRSDAETIGVLRLEAHNFKGMGTSFGYPTVSLVAHRLEDYLSGLKRLDEKQLIDAQIFIDRISELVDRAEQPAAGRDQPDHPRAAGALRVPDHRRRSPQRRDHAGHPVQGRRQEAGDGTGGLRLPHHDGDRPDRVDQPCRPRAPGHGHRVDGYGRPVRPRPDPRPACHERDPPCADGAADLAEPRPPVAEGDPARRLRHPRRRAFRRRFRRGGGQAQSRLTDQIGQAAPRLNVIVI